MEGCECEIIVIHLVLIFTKSITNFWITFVNEKQ